MNTKNVKKLIALLVLLLIPLLAVLLLAQLARSGGEEAISEAAEITAELPRETGNAQPEAELPSVPADVSPTPDVTGIEDGLLPIDLSVRSALPARAVWSDGSTLTISAAGAYRLTGVLEGRIVVDADGPVELHLAGAGITGPECLRILSDSPVTIVTEAGTQNVLSDGADGPDDSGDDAIYAKAPLTFDGSGALTVIAYAHNAVRCKADVEIAGGTLFIRAANSGIKADGQVTVTGGDLQIASGGDGIAAQRSRLADGSVAFSGGSTVIRSDGRGIDAENAALFTGGSLTIESAGDAVRAETADISGGSITIDAQEDGIQTVSLLSVSGGVLDLTAGGGGGDAISHAGESFGPWASVSSSDTPSAKGLKSDGDITVSGGVLTLNTADDSIHCGGVFTMEDGELSIVSSDDAVHADDMLVVGGGRVDIRDCFEGLEAFAVEIRGGDVVIRAVNDGINANGAEMMFGNRSQESFQSVSGAATTYFLMSGGTLDLAVTGTMSNMGDGVDSNGAVYITGGEMVVSTFGTFMENGLDTGWGGPVVTGGKVIAGGSSTMAEGFSSYSTQCCAVISTSYMPDGTRVTITDEDGNEIWSVVLQDGFSCLQVSHPDMLEGHVYTLSYGDQSTELDFTSTTNIENSRGFGGFRPF